MCDKIWYIYTEENVRKVLGITGGVGSGKSEVLDYLESRYGAYVCQMDEVAKRLEKRGEICFRKIVDRFGEAVVGTDGELDRKKLGEIVFSDEGKRKILNEIVHPPVLDYVKGCDKRIPLHCY